MQYSAVQCNTLQYIAAYVEDYNFDVPEGMDLMFHRHSRLPESSDVRQDCQMDVYQTVSYAPVYQTVSYATKDACNTSDNDSLTMTADENDPDMNDFYQRVVSSDDENYLDSDNGSITDFDGSMSEGAYCVVSDDGSAADLDMDILNIINYNNLDVWSVTDFSSCSLDVDVEDDCDFNMISVKCTYMVDAYAYCALLARRLYGFYGTGPWMNSGWTIRVLLPGTRVLRILGLYWCVMIACV